MTIPEFIKQEYEKARVEFDILKEQQTYLELKTNNYIETVQWLNLCLTSLILKQEDTAKTAFNNIIKRLLINCQLDRIKPKLVNNELGYGFKSFNYREREQILLQYMEGYIVAQTPRYEVVWFIECGIKLNLIELEK